jgi:large subunit ribosomal protein L17
MRHGKKINHLGRTSTHRKAMLSNMASSLILHKRISTTLAKAKALRVFVEPLITRSKDDSTHNRRMAFSYLQNKEAVSELFREISKKIAERPGGYTRILKTGNRLGDNADMCFIELVDYNETMLSTKETAKSKATRRRRTPSGKKKEDVTEAAEESVATGLAEKKAKKPIEKMPVAEVVEKEEITDQTVEPETIEPTEEPTENKE